MVPRGARRWHERPRLGAHGLGRGLLAERRSPRRARANAARPRTRPDLSPRAGPASCNRGRRKMTRRLGLAVVLATATMLAIASTMVPRAEAQLVRDSRFAGLQWTFVRIKYTANTQPGRYRMEYWGEPWAIDGPAAEQNLSRRIKTVTAIDVADPVVLTLEDARLWEYPWIYFVEPGNLRFKDTEVPIVREFLLRGGTATFDDFHGPYEWDNLARELKRLFPERDIVELEPSHPVFS